MSELPLYAISPPYAFWSTYLLWQTRAHVCPFPTVTNCSSLRGTEKVTNCSDPIPTVLNPTFTLWKTPTGFSQQSWGSPTLQTLNPNPNPYTLNLQPLQAVTTSEVVCTSPKFPAGIVAVHVSVDGGVFSRSAVRATV